MKIYTDLVGRARAGAAFLHPRTTGEGALIALTALTTAVAATAFGVIGATVLGGMSFAIYAGERKKPTAPPVARSQPPAQPSVQPLAPPVAQGKTISQLPAQLLAPPVAQGKTISQPSVQLLAPPVAQGKTISQLPAQPLAPPVAQGKTISQPPAATVARVTLSPPAKAVPLPNLGNTCGLAAIAQTYLFDLEQEIRSAYERAAPDSERKVVFHNIIQFMDEYRRQASSPSPGRADITPLMRAFYLVSRDYRRDWCEQRDQFYLTKENERVGGESYAGNITALEEEIRIYEGYRKETPTDKGILSRLEELRNELQNEIKGAGKGNASQQQYLNCLQAYCRQKDPIAVNPIDLYVALRETRRDQGSALCGPQPDVAILIDDLYNYVYEGSSSIVHSVFGTLKMNPGEKLVGKDPQRYRITDPQRCSDKIVMNLDARQDIKKNGTFAVNIDTTSFTTLLQRVFEEKVEGQELYATDLSVEKPNGSQAKERVQIITQKNLFSRAFDPLVIHVNRTYFHKATGRNYRIEGPIAEFTEAVKVKGEYVGAAGDVTYRLKAVISGGTVGGGHYTAMVRKINPETGKDYFVVCNDSSILTHQVARRNRETRELFWEFCNGSESGSMPITQERFRAQAALGYILFYEKISV